MTFDQPVTLGSRIVRLHLKDFKMDRSAGRFDWKNIGEGDIVRRTQAIVEKDPKKQQALLREAQDLSAKLSDKFTDLTTDLEAFNTEPLV